MISAGDAKKKTQSNIDNCTTKELRLLEKQINKAISDGRFSISNNGFLEFQDNVTVTKDHTTEETIPSLIILDAGDADTLNGIEICKNLRSNPNFDRTKIIVTSVYHDKEMVLNAGADLYIPKPYDISGLIKWVETLLLPY